MNQADALNLIKFEIHQVLPIEGLDLRAVIKTPFVDRDRDFEHIQKFIEMLRDLRGVVRANVVLKRDTASSERPHKLEYFEVWQQFPKGVQVTRIIPNHCASAHQRIVNVAINGRFTTLDCGQAYLWENMAWALSYSGDESDVCNTIEEITVVRQYECVAGYEAACVQIISQEAVEAMFEIFHNDLALAGFVGFSPIIDQSGNLLGYSVSVNPYAYEFTPRTPLPLMVEVSPAEDGWTVTAMQVLDPAGEMEDDGSYVLFPVLESVESDDDELIWTIRDELGLNMFVEEDWVRILHFVNEQV